MRKRYLAIIFLISSLAAVGFVFWAAQPVEIPLNKVEIADSAEELEKGLMNRTDLCHNCGMLFVFERPGPVSFWMKNTPLPLDIIMMTESGRVTDVHHGTEPYSEKSLPSSSNQVKYVLEVNAGRGDVIRVGQRIDINMLIALSR